MRTSTLKAVAFSLAALALAAAPAFAGDPGAPVFIPGGGGGPHGGFMPSPGRGPGGAGPGGAPKGNFTPPTGGAPQGNIIPPSGGAPKGAFVSHPSFYQHAGPKQHQALMWLRRHHRGRPVYIGPGIYGYDYYGNGYYYYDKSDCWVYVRAYNRHGKFIGWRLVYICYNN